MATREAQQPCRILLADSGELLCEQVKAMLAGTCCEIVAVRDGFDVICRLPGIRPDLLLMSSELPRLNGLQICALLRQCPDYRELPVVLMVNDATAVKQARAELAGVSECLQKPFRRSELEAALMRLVNSDSVLTAVA